MSIPSLSLASPPRTRRLVIGAAMAAVAAIAAAVLAQGDPHSGWWGEHWLAKPLATALLLWLAWRTGDPLSPRYRARVCAGLALALVGDVLLMWPGDLFVPGLVAFLLAHLWFLAAWLDDSRFAVRPLGWLVCLAAAAALVALVWSGLAPALRPAVIVCAATLATMAGQAVGRARMHAAAADALARPARWAAIGALLFMASDSLLAWDRFGTPLPMAALWILGTYYPALWAIARSVERDRDARGRAA